MAQWIRITTHQKSETNDVVCCMQISLKPQLKHKLIKFICDWNHPISVDDTHWHNSKEIFAFILAKIFFSFWIHSRFSAGRSVGCVLEFIRKGAKMRTAEKVKHGNKNETTTKIWKSQQSKQNWNEIEKFETK